MNSTDDQTLVHAIAGIARSLSTLSTLLQEMQTARVLADAEMINLLKMISRKH